MLLYVLWYVRENPQKEWIKCWHRDMSCPSVILIVWFRNLRLNWHLTITWKLYKTFSYNEPWLKVQGQTTTMEMKHPNAYKTEYQIP